MDKRSESERERRRDVTSEREFFDIIKLQFVDDIKDTLNINKDLPAGVHFALTNFRLMIMGADSPSILAESIVSMELDKKALEFCYRARSEYQLFTAEAAVNEIKSSSIDDDDTRSKIKNYYSLNADRDIELVFSKMSSLLGLMDETYNYSIFKGRQLNEIIKKIKSNEDELIKKIQIAHNKSYFDEEDQFIEKLKNNKERLDIIGNIKISFYRYDKELNDKMINNISTLKLRVKYCAFMSANARKNSASNEEVSFWYSKMKLAESCQKYIEKGSLTSYEEYCRDMDKEKGEEVEFEQRMQEERDSWGQNEMGGF